MTVLKKKKRIIIVAPFPPPFGGIASYVQYLRESELLQSSFCLSYVDTSQGESFIHGEGRGDITWSRWQMFLMPSNWGFMLFVIINYLEFLWKMLLIRPDVVHVHTCSYFGFIRSGVFLFLARFFPCRRILHLHNAIDLFYADYGQHPFWGRAIQWSLHQASEFVVLSEGLKVWVKEHLEKEATVIWNACSSEKYRGHNRWKLEEKFPEANGRLVVLMLGGIHSHKGAFDLLQVIATLEPDERSRMLFLLPGRGDVDKALAYIKVHALESLVLLPGMVPEEIKDDMLRGADIFVLPSYSEGQPIAILEAMSASLPVIATNIASIPEVIKEGQSGYLINPGDQKALRDQLLVLARDKELRKRMGIVARERVDMYHDISRLLEATAALYSGVYE